MTGCDAQPPETLDPYAPMRAEDGDVASQSKVLFINVSNSGFGVLILVRYRTAVDLDSP